LDGAATTRTSSGLDCPNLPIAIREDPHVFDVTRATSAHLGFGHGPHFCLGQRLARKEIKVALREILARFSALELAAPVGIV
jgi:cytochrome P450